MTKVTNTNPQISVVVLCYREGMRITAFVEKTVELLEQLHDDWEIVLVANYDDDVTDKTPQAAQNMAAQRSNIKAVTMQKQGGMGWDALIGLKQASGKFLCLIDGDGQMPPENIIKVYKKIQEEGLDLVTTYRTERGDSLARKINSYAYNFIFRILFPRVKVRDANSKPKIFSREAFSKMHLTANDWFLDAEMLIQSARMNFRTGEIPVTFNRSISRKSFVRMDAIFEFARNLLRARIKEFFPQN